MTLTRFPASASFGEIWAIYSVDVLPKINEAIERLNNEIERRELLQRLGA